MIRARSTVLATLDCADAREPTCAVLCSLKLLRANSGAASEFFVFASFAATRLNTCAVRGCAASLKTSSTIGLKYGGSGGLGMTGPGTRSGYKRVSSSRNTAFFRASCRAADVSMTNGPRRQGLKMQRPLYSDTL